MKLESLSMKYELIQMEDDQWKCDYFSKLIVGVNEMKTYNKVIVNRQVVNKVM